MRRHKLPAFNLTKTGQYKRAKRELIDELHSELAEDLESSHRASISPILSAPQTSTPETTYDHELLCSTSNFLAPNFPPRHSTSIVHSPEPPSCDIASTQASESFAFELLRDWSQISMPGTEIMSELSAIFDAEDEADSGWEDEDEVAPVFDSEDELPPDDDSLPPEEELSAFNDLFVRVEDANVLAPLIDDAQPGSSTVDNLKEFLQEWTVGFGIKQRALSALCGGLSRIVPDPLSDLPKARAIMHTPRAKCNVRDVKPGEYFHIGLRYQLTFIMTLLATASICCLDLIFNIDGLPIFKSMPSEMWPILFSCPNIEKLSHKAFPIGLYFGPEKPEDVSLFLQDFVTELLDILENGFEFMGSIIHINILNFCCDLPARAFLLGTIGHTGFFSCGRCKAQGETVDKRRVFRAIDCPKRTDEEFRQRTDKHFQPANRKTPLILLRALNFVSDFVLDPMHLIDLGVMRRMLRIWCNGGVPFQLSLQQRVLMSEKLLALRMYVPLEFARLPRVLVHLARWKATECRAFLLYYGPIVLSGILSEEKYLHFLALHVAISILSNPVLCKDDELREYARGLLRYFVSNMTPLYAAKFVTHNFHSLIHIVDDCDNFVRKIRNFSLYSISAYPFENFLQSIKKMVSTTTKVLQQVSRRFIEATYTLKFRQKYVRDSRSEVTFEVPHNDGPLLPSCSGPQYRKAVFPKFTIINDGKNNCCTMKDGSIVLIENIVYSAEKESQVLIGKKFTDKRSFFSVGDFCSTKLGVFKVSKLGYFRQIWLPSDVLHKNVRLPCKDSWVVFPLLHTASRG